MFYKEQVIKMIYIEKVKETIKKAFDKIIFDEKNHKYYVDGIELISATTSLKNFSEEFDTERMSELSAQKYNKNNPNKPKKNAEWFKREWRKKQKEAAKKGTRVHLYAEQYPNLAEPICNQEKGIQEWFNTLDKKYVILFSELRMYDLNIKKAGTADLILLNTETGKLVIADWKTNNTNIFQVYAKKKMKAPFEKLLDNSYSKYCLQLSLYQLIIELNTNLEVEDRWLVWLKEGDYFNLEEDKDPKYYSIQEVKCDNEGIYYKQFSLLSYKDDLKLSINEKKVIKKKLTVKKMGAKLKKSIFSKNKKSK
jgi:hypothetical protein